MPSTTVCLAIQRVNNWMQLLRNSSTKCKCFTLCSQQSISVYYKYFCYTAIPGQPKGLKLKTRKKAKRMTMKLAGHYSSCVFYWKFLYCHSCGTVTMTMSHNVRKHTFWPAPNEDSNQPAHPRWSVFVFRMKNTLHPWLSKIRRRFSSGRMKVPNDLVPRL